MSDKLLNILDQVPVFGGLSEQSLALILNGATVYEREAGQCFFSEGESASSMFVLEQGDVVVLKAWQQKNYVIGNLKAGDCFGEMSLIDLQPRSATIRATCPSKAIEISVDCIYQIWSKDPEQYTMLQMNMAREVSRRLRLSDETLFEKRVLAAEIAPQE